MDGEVSYSKEFDEEAEPTVESNESDRFLLYAHPSVTHFIDWTPPRNRSQNTQLLTVQALVTGHVRTDMTGTIQSSVCPPLHVPFELRYLLDRRACRSIGRLVTRLESWLIGRRACYLGEEL